MLAVGMRAVAHAFLAGIALRVEGREHVPARGPVLLVCRHYHHLYDGAALTAALDRAVRIVVGLDWVNGPAQRRRMEAICKVAGWPVVLRDPGSVGRWGGGYDLSERRDYARKALLLTDRLLARGEVVAIFPEGAPQIDPAGAGARPQWPAFDPGFLTIAVRSRRLGIELPLVPVGLSYAGADRKPASIVVRFGSAELLSPQADRRRVGERLEAAVRRLSV